MTVRVIPQTDDGIISLSTQCVAATIALEAELEIKQNTAAAVSADHYDLVGAPGTDPATAGKQGALNVARRTLLTASETRRSAVAAGRAFNEHALDHLKGFLGRRWNPRWVAAGFTGASLALPRDPKPLLLEFRAYFIANPTQELPVNQVTAARANTLALAIDQAVLAEAAADTTRAAALEARDESMARVRARLVGLRSELDQLMEDDDMRWRTFGFARPIDRRIPQAVSGLTLRASGTSGEIIAQWNAAVGAETYRVLRQVQGVDHEPAEVGLFSDRVAIISGLPSGKTVIVSVSARNPAGETSATNSAFLVA